MPLAADTIVEVTVCVIFHNEEHHIPELLESFEQNILYEPSASQCYFLFIDNASQDQSKGLIETWIEKRDNCLLLERGENHLAQARNQALKASQTPWLAFVDADTHLQKEWWQEVQKAIGGASPRINIIGGGSQYLIAAPWHSYAQSLDHYFPLGKDQERRIFVEHVSTNNCLMRREAILSMGGFHEFFKRVGEDLDLSVRASRAGLIAYQPTFWVHHQLPAKVGDWYQKMALYGRAQSYVLLRNRGGIPWVKFIPVLCLFVWIFLLISKPSFALLLVVLFLISSRLRFYFLSFLFYGLGELVGLFLYFPQKR